MEIFMDTETSFSHTGKSNLTLCFRCNLFHFLNCICSLRWSIFLIVSWVLKFLVLCARFRLEIGLNLSFIIGNFIRFWFIHSNEYGYAFIVDHFVFSSYLLSTCLLQRSVNHSTHIPYVNEVSRWACFVLHFLLLMLFISVFLSFFAIVRLFSLSFNFFSCLRLYDCCLSDSHTSSWSHDSSASLYIARGYVKICC